MSSLYNTVLKFVNDIFGLCITKGLTTVDFLNDLNILQQYNNPKSQFFRDKVYYFSAKVNFYNNWLELFDGTIRDLGISFNTIQEKVDSALASIRRIYQQTKYSQKYPTVKDFGNEIKLAFKGLWINPNQPNYWNDNIVVNFPEFFSNEFVKNQVGYKAYIGYYLRIDELISQMDLTFINNLFDSCIDLLKSLEIYYKAKFYSDENFNGKYKIPTRIGFEVSVNNKIFRSSWLDIDFNQFLVWFEKFIYSAESDIEKYKIDKDLEVLDYIRPITPMVDISMFKERFDSLGNTELRVSNHIDYR